MLKICLVTFFTLAAAASRCAAAANEGVSGGQFLRIGAGAKASALGEAAATLSGAQALFYNPAGLAAVTGMELYLSQVRWIMETNYSNLAFAKRAGSAVYALSASYLAAPSTQKYDKFGTRLADTYSASDMAVALGYGRRLGAGTDIGLSVKYISSRLDTEEAAALAADAGIKYAAVPGRLEFGASVQNAGGSLKYIDEGDALPLNFKLGGAYTLNLERDRATRKDISFFADVNRMKDSGAYANVGADLMGAYDRDTNFSIRAGYRTNAGGKSAGIAGGLGLEMANYLLDYAYAPMGDLGNTHRFSFTLKFGARKLPAK